MQIYADIINDTIAEILIVINRFGKVVE